MSDPETSSRPVLHESAADGWVVVREGERFYVEHLPTGARSGAYNESGAESLLWILRLGDAAQRLGRS